MEKIGRKKTLFLGMIGSGIFCIVSEFVGGDLAKTITFVIGKMLITIAFSCLYIYTIEVFPTNLRHRLFSICSVVGRIGSILAPLTPIMVQNVWSRLPLILFSVFALSSALFLCALPETLNKKLPDTVDEAFNWKQIKIFPHSIIKIFKLRKNNFFMLSSEFSFCARGTFEDVTISYSKGPSGSSASENNQIIIQTKDAHSLACPSWIIPVNAIYNLAFDIRRLLAFWVNGAWT